MKNITIFSLACFFIGATNATIITVDHNITQLPPSGYLQTDLDGDGHADINLASNFYVSVSNQDTRYTAPYSFIGEVIDAKNVWQGGNDWIDLYGSVKNYAQNGFLYLGIRNTTIGDYYGYIKFNYNPTSNSVSLNSYTYENSGLPITVGASTVPEPAAPWSFGLGLIGLIGVARRKAVQFLKSSK